MGANSGHHIALANFRIKSIRERVFGLRHEFRTVTIKWAANVYWFVVFIGEGRASLTKLYFQISYVLFK